MGDHGHRFACALVASGHEVTVLTAGDAEDTKKYRLVRLGHEWNLIAALRGCALLARMRPSSLLIEYTPFIFGSRSLAPFAFALAARLSRIACTVIVHEIFYGTDSESIKSRQKARYFALRDTIMLSLAARIAVPNADRRSRIAARLPRVADKIDIVPIAANIEPDASYRRAVAHSGPIEIAAFGIVMPRRRYELAMDALAIARRTIDVRITIIGRIFDEHEHYFNACIAHADKIGVRPYVNFTGALSPPEVSQRLSRAHIGIHTAYEGSTRSSGSLLALLAHGVPVVAARTEHDDKCFDGLVTYAGVDPSALARAIVALAESPHIAEEFGRRAREEYRTAFDWRALTNAVVSKATSSCEIPQSRSSLPVLHTSRRGGAPDA
ncbi:MAG: glycosyltransferase family 4 protein [Vulcanimicrobiaceae bacterium]